MTAQLQELTPPSIDPGHDEGAPIDAVSGLGERARPEPRLTARSLARLHDRYLSAIWRGVEMGEVADWLAAHWDEAAPPMPDRVPDAVSFGGGVGIRWYCQGAVVTGYSPRAESGCYRIPVWSTPPVVLTRLR